VLRKVSTSTIEVLLILKIEQCYRLGAPSVYPSVINSHQAFKKGCGTDVVLGGSLA
jgi:hypothetical protein